MKRLFLFIFFYGLIILSIKAQNTYSFQTVYNDRYGINKYEGLNFRIGGDSVRKCNGYACRGWIKDYYDDGSVMHHGFYIDGQLKNYKNFYPNGGVEREYKILDDFRSVLSTYYPTGQLRSEVKYNKSSAVLWQDFYANGNPEYYEEYDRGINYFVAQRFYYENGAPKSLIELENKKKLEYTKKEFHENGSIKASGKMIYNKSQLDYQKSGLWIDYDESGKEITRQEY